MVPRVPLSCGRSKSQPKEWEISRRLSLCRTSHRIHFFSSLLIAGTEKEIIFLLFLVHVLATGQLSLGTKSIKADPVFPQRGRLTLVKRIQWTSPGNTRATNSFQNADLPTWLLRTWYFFPPVLLMAPSSGCMVNYVQPFTTLRKKQVFIPFGEVLIGCKTSL